MNATTLRFATGLAALILSLIVGACSGAETQSLIETAIAQTQQIGRLETAAASGISNTPLSESEVFPAEATPTEANPSTQPPTPVPTQTPKPAGDWNGTWTMWWGNNTYVVTLTMSGNKISGSFGEGVQMIVIEGTLSNNGQNASGTWTYPQGEGDGNFEWQLKAGNPNQFVGNNNFGIAPWCGAKSGASKPDPCQWP